MQIEPALISKLSILYVTRREHVLATVQNGCQGQTGEVLIVATVAIQCSKIKLSSLKGAERTGSGKSRAAEASYDFISNYFDN